MSAPNPRPRPPLERAARAAGLSVSREGAAGASPGYERLGNVVIVDENALPHESQIAWARALADALEVRTVLARSAGPRGRMRRQTLRRVWGDPDTRTTVVQHGIQYAFDPMRVMFSAGNLEERRRMGQVAADGQTVVDLFAGLGYLSLPIAKHARARRVVGCEINPEAAAFLARNVVLNQVSDVYEARTGDCRAVAPRGIADRVLMGYLHGTDAFLDTAFETLKPTGGLLHFHYKHAMERWPNDVFRMVEHEARAAGRTVRLAGWRKVKSYAPRVIHGVLDIEVTAT